MLARVPRWVLLLSSDEMGLDSLPEESKEDDSSLSMLVWDGTPVMLASDSDKILCLA